MAESFLGTTMERERKFLVRSLPTNLRSYPHEFIEQGYLAVEKGSHGTEVRIRKLDKHWLLTVKRGSGDAREEKEMPILASRARSLWGLTKHRRVKKVRYKVPYRAWTIEIDIYRGNANGLCVAEVEFRV